MTIYTAKVPWGETLKFDADLSRAEMPIRYADGKEWISTPYQTGDARHDAANAVRLLLDYFGSDYYQHPDDARDPDTVLDEIMEDVEITAEDEDDD